MRKVLYLLDQTEFTDASLPKLPEGFEQRILTQNASAQERRKEISDAEIVFGEPTLEELHHAKKLRWVQMFWAGADRYLGGDFPENVLLTTASGAFGETISEHALAMMFALCRRLPEYLRANDWVDRGSEKRISGATAMIFGCGDIGSEIAKRLKALGLHTIGVCRNARSPRRFFDALTTLSCAAAFLPDADFIFCAMPSNQDTDGFFDETHLSFLKKDAVLINVGRGRFIDTNALTACLKAGKLFGVGLDVTHPEPLPPDHPLRAFPNVIITPHVAGVSFGHLPETERKILSVCEENLMHYLKNEPLMNTVIVP